MADPTRRRLLELLRDGPRTTGELCSAFDLTRYGVMKHLQVLEAAKLVVARREGRKRFNHLNAVPLQRVHRRFVNTFAARNASMLLHLEQHLQNAERPQTMNQAPNLAFHITQELEYGASKEQVWAALTKDVGRWWAFHIGPSDSSITLDGRVAGQFIERWGDGEGELYATVTFLKKGEKLTLEGAMGMAGPGYSKFSFALSETGAGTKVTLDHYCHGYRGEDVETRYREGWEELLGTHLRAWLEEGKPCSAS